jgi:hypothetical protein
VIINRESRKIRGQAVLFCRQRRMPYNTAISQAILAGRDVKEEISLAASAGHVAFGLIGHSIWGWISPLLNLLQHLFDAIPKNERWAAERYGNEWQEYTGRIKRLIPYIY